MFFLDVIDDILDWIEGIGEVIEDIGNIIEDIFSGQIWYNLLNMIIIAVRFIGGWLCNFIYWVIGCMYQIFISIAQIDILTAERIQPIYQRFTLILTIVMVFYITFEFVKFVVQPDNITDKEKGAGNIVVRMILVIVLIAFVPTIFSYAKVIQDKVISTQVFSKVLLGTSTTDYKKMGSTLSADVLSLFYYPEPDSDEYQYGDTDDSICNLCHKYRDESGNLKSNDQYGSGEKMTKDDCYESCEAQQNAVERNINQLKTEGTIDITGSLSFIISLPKQIGKAPVKFDGILAILVGGFMAYILILYNVDLGVRYGQLVFLQLIAPVAIMGYLSPKKDGIFQRWTKQCVTTYLDLFIRLAIIHFIIIIINVLNESYQSGELFSGIADLDPGAQVFVFIFLLLGLLLFAYKAPKMLEELFPHSGGAASIGFGLNASKRVAPMAARAIGAGWGGANRLVKGAIARGRLTRQRNQEIRDRRRAEDKDTSRRAIRRERRQIAAAERAAQRALRNANFRQGMEDLGTRKERKAVTDAEIALEKARRRGNKTEIEKATETLNQAKKTLRQKKAELAVNEEIRSNERSLKKAQRQGDTIGKTEFEKKRAELDATKIAIASIGKTQAKTEENLKNANEKVEAAKVKAEKTAELVARQEKIREINNKKVENAERQLEEARKTNDVTKIAQAEANLEKAKIARDSQAVYDQEQIITAKQAKLQQNQQAVEMAQNAKNQAEGKHQTATQAVTEAEAKLQSVRNDQNNKVLAAAKALEAAKASKDPEREAEAKRKLDEATIAQTTAIAKADAELNQAKAKEISSKKDLLQAQKELNTATTTRDGLEQEIKADQMTKLNLEQKRDQKLERAKEINTKAIDAMKKAESARDHIMERKTNNDMIIEENAKKTKENASQARAEYARAESDLAEAQNLRLRSEIGNTIIGAAQGAWRGATTGLSATKLEEIHKKVVEGEKKDIKSIAAHEQWLDSGGTTVASRIKANVQQNIGGYTDSQATEMQIKNYDNQVSTNKRIGAIEGAVKTNVDSAKSRSGSKIEAGEQKTPMTLYDNAPIRFTDITGHKQTWIDSNSDYIGMSTSEIYQLEKNEAQMARERAQAAHQAAANAEAQGSSNAAELRRNAEAAALAATKKEQELGQKKKALEEYAITSVLQTPKSLRRNKMYQPDQVLVENVENSLQSIEESKRNSDTYNKMIKALGDINPSYVQAYTSGNIRDFDTLDAIQVALTTIKGQRDRDIATAETMSGILKASSKLESDKAAASANGGK